MRVKTWLKIRAVETVLLRGWVCRDQFEICSGGV